VRTEEKRLGRRRDDADVCGIRADGKQLPPRFFTIKGNVAHIDAMVIKFEQDFIKKGDPLRGHSLVLFHRLYGDYQAPVEGFMIDMPGKPPEVYRIPNQLAGGQRV
jgi:hypothetical protein